MKKIDTSSKKFRDIKSVLSWISATGGVLVFDSVFVPCVEIMFGKSRLLKFVSNFGIVSLSTASGLVSYAVTNFGVEGAARAWNDIADKVNGNDEIDIPSDEAEAEPKDSYSYTFFGDDADVRAHDIVLQLEHIIDEHGVVTVNDLRRIQHRDPIDNGDTIGWTQDDLYHSEIETLLDSNNHVGAILTLNNPHDISEHYVVIKPSGKKKEEEE